MSFMFMLVYVFIFAILATLYFGIRWLISKATHKNKNYGKKALASIGVLAGGLIIVGVTSAITSHNEKKYDAAMSSSNNSESSSKKQAKISKIKNAGSPDSLGNYSITMNDKSTIDITGKATPNSSNQCNQ